MENIVKCPHRLGTTSKKNKPLVCDQSYMTILGKNSFGHPNNVLTLINKANGELEKSLLQSFQQSSPSVLNDGTERMSTRDVFDSMPSRYSQTPCELSYESERVARLNDFKNAEVDTPKVDTPEVDTPKVDTPASE